MKRDTPLAYRYLAIVLVMLAIVAFFGFRPVRPIAEFILSPAIALFALLASADAFGWLRPVHEPALEIVLGPALLLVALVFTVTLWARLLRALLHRGTSLRGSIIPTMVLLSCGLIALASHSFPWFRDKARSAPCDNAYVQLNGEVANALDDPSACGSTDAMAVVACVLERHRGARNPLDESLPAYTTGDPVACQVQLESVGEHTVVFRQWVWPDSEAARTFSVSIE